MSGFVDLRLNRQDGQVNESFWPSFTDIMTVVMMIFLIAMVVLLMRNMELVKELRATMAAERLAAEHAAQTGAANQSLSTKLTDAQARIAQLQQQLGDAQASAAQQDAAQQQIIDTQRREIATLLSERNDLAEQLALANLAVERQQQQLTDLQAQTGTLQEQLAGAEARLTNTMRQRDEMDIQLTEAQQALAAAQREQQTSVQQYSQLVGKFDELRVKYDKLIRPARSPNGRYLVEVRYGKRDGVPVIQFREGTQGAYAVLPRDALNQRLSALKTQHSEGLYVKVIIPEDSGLSYNEAWSFTREMLGLYDYYYEGQQDQLRPDR